MFLTERPSAEKLEDYLIDYTGKISRTQLSMIIVQNVVAKVADEYLNKRDSISGVSENEETVNMMTYQKSFNAYFPYDDHLG